MKLTCCDNSESRMHRLTLLWELIRHRGLGCKVKALDDHEGNLTVKWSEIPSHFEALIVSRLWCDAFNEAYVEHHYRGREIWG